MPMKKVYLFCLLAFLAFGTSTASANDGKLSKVLQKECKQQIKRLKKEGWTVWGKTQTIESALEAHFLEMEEYGIDAVSIEGRATAKTPNIAIQKATSHAKAQYSSMKSSKVRVATQTEMTNKSGAETESETKFTAVSSSQTESVIKEFNPTVVLCRTTKNGIYEVLALFVLKD